MTKSEIFTQYNKARAAAHQGKLDPKRVNRALGIAQTKATEQKYITSIKSCTCEDHKRNSTPCKHMIAKMIEVKIDRANIREKLVAEPVEPKVIYVELEYASMSPWNITINFWDAANCKMSEGKGLIQIDSEVLAEKLQNYKVIKTQYVKKNTWGTHSFKMWWEKK
jgi:hypothetical protein